MLKYENITWWTDVALYKLIALQTNVKTLSNKNLSKILSQMCFEKDWVINLCIFHIFMQQFFLNLDVMN